MLFIERPMKIINPINKSSMKFVRHIMILRGANNFGPVTIKNRI